jgi:hypothetical protein
MRGLSILALLAVGALVLSGCSSKDSGSSSTSGTGTKSSTGKNGTKAITNTTSLPPNIPPMVKLTVTNETGVAANVTLVGGSLVFSAVGSMDPDSDGLSAVAITAQDSNRTYPPGVLYAAGKFTSVTYKFDRPGVVNVTVSGIDVRGDLTTITSQVYVDQTVTLKSNTLNVPAGAATAKASSCKGATGQAITDAFVFDTQPFNVAKGATYLTGDKQAQSAGTVQFAFCLKKADGTATAVSADDTSGHVESNVDPLPAVTGLDSYVVAFVAKAPQTTGYVKVVVHYEPKAAAAA